MPSVFLRLAGCNLTCSWCDTKYTWDWQTYDYDQEVMSLDLEDVERRILKFGCPRLIITGGEPLMQQRAWAPLVASLKERGFYCEVETNGTIVPQPGSVSGIDRWNVSPKLSTSGNDQQRREVPQALQFFRGLPTTFFKFVVVEPADVDEVCTWRDKYNLPRERIILMPEGRSVDAIQEKSAWISEACIREGFRFSTRLHILLWADARGR